MRNRDPGKELQEAAGDSGLRHPGRLEHSLPDTPLVSQALRAATTDHGSPVCATSGPPS